MNYYLVLFAAAAANPPPLVVRVRRGASFAAELRAAGVEVRTVGEPLADIRDNASTSFGPSVLEALLLNERAEYRAIGRHAQLQSRDASLQRYLVCDPFVFGTFERDPLSVARLSDAAIGADGTVCEEGGERRCIAPAGCSSAAALRTNTAAVALQRWTAARLGAAQRPPLADLVVLTQRWGHSYFHFVCEALVRLAPALAAIATSGRARARAAHVHVASAAPPFVAELLSAVFGIEHSRIVDGLQRSKRVWLAESVACGTPSLAQVAGLRGALHAGALLPVRASDARRTTLLVRRTVATSRRLRNWGELREALAAAAAALGDVLVTFDDARLPSARATLALFARAHAVVAAHGAALANLVAASPGAVVVEVLDRGDVRVCYAALAAKLDLHYRAVAAVAPGFSAPTARVVALAARGAGGDESCGIRAASAQEVDAL